MPVVLYHNPNCSKSRATLALLRDRGIAPTIIEYLRTPLSKDQIIDLIGQLDVPATDLLRRSTDADALADASTGANDAAYIAATLARHPERMQRPIVVHNGQARICRPPAAVLDIL